MPIVILPAPGNVPTGPGPVLNNQRMPTINTAGQEQGLANLGEAMAKPMMDKSQAMPYEALGAVGKAVADAGSVMMALQEQRIKSESEVQVGEVDRQLKMAWAKEVAWQQSNPRTTEWDAHWEKSYQPLKEQINARSDIHKEARKMIGLGMMKFEGDTSIALVENGSKVAFNQAASLRNLKVGNLINEGKYDDAKKEFAAGVGSGHFAADGALKIDKEIELAKKAKIDAAKSVDYNAIQSGLAEESGYGAFVVLDALKENSPDDPTRSASYQSLDPDERRQMINRAETEVRKVQADNIDGQGGIYDRIISEKDPIHENGIRMAGEALRLPENKIQDLIDFKKKHDEVKLKNTPFDQPTASALFNDIMDYKEPVDSNLDEWSKLAQRVELLGESGGESGRLTKSVLKQQLYLRHPYQVEGKTNSVLTDGVSKLLTAKLNEFMANGYLGNVYINIPKKKPTAAGFEIVPGEFEQARNPAVAVKYAESHIMLSNALKVEMEKNPEIISDPDALGEWMNKKLGGVKAGVSVDLDGLGGPDASLLPGDRLFTP